MHGVTLALTSGKNRNVAIGETADLIWNGGVNVPFFRLMVKPLAFLVLQNINKRGNVQKSSKKEKPFTVGPVVLAFFLFVVVGSSVCKSLSSPSIGIWGGRLLQFRVGRIRLKSVG